MSEIDWRRRLHPRLRVISNGAESVNACRASSSSCVVSIKEPGDTKASLWKIAFDAVQFAAGETQADELDFPSVPKKQKKLTPDRVAEQAFVNVIVETQPAEPDGPSHLKPVKEALDKLSKASRLPREVATGSLVRRGFVAARIPVAKLPDIAAAEGVCFVHAADPLTFRLPVAVDGIKLPAPEPRAVKLGSKALTGEGVLIGIIDVGGFDFAHKDFLDSQGNTRFVSIWDQGGSSRPPPDGFRRGAELTSKHLNAAICNPKGWPAHLYERQSQMQPGSHGTHVASIAAGRHGVCPKARIAAVLVDIPSPTSELEARKWAFVDSTAIVEAIEYLAGVAKQLKLPLSINISLGTNGGPHDGANGTCRWIDSFLAQPGRAISVAAGNAGQERGLTSDDLGWLMGRIHTAGQVAARGLTVDLNWVVVGDGIADMSENELELWYGAQDRISVAIQPPGSSKWYHVKPGEYIQNMSLGDGTRLSIYNEIFHPVNGDNYIAIYLSPDYENLAPIGAGIWKVRLHGDEIRDGRFHGWIERDDPVELERLEGLRAFRFPSFFAGASNVDSHSISSLACAHRVIAVANADARAGTINISSSQGPTRDDRSKPEVAAPGTDIVAARGFDPDNLWMPMTGTSMASPYVCGVVGLMLNENQNLTSAQCQGILKRTSKPLPSMDYAWRNDVGYGLLDPVGALAEAKTLGRLKPVAGEQR